MQWSNEHALKKTVFINTCCVLAPISEHLTRNCIQDAFFTALPDEHKVFNICSYRLALRGWS
jgi:hypothetical protein